MQQIMLYHHVLIALFVVNVPIVTGLEPDFLYPLQNVTIPQGRDATFTCVVNNLGGYRVAWIKADTKAILAIHEHVITNNARLSVTHNDQNTWTLNIRGARREDRGIYMCQVNTDPMKSQSAFLEVVIPPDIISEETSNDLMVPEGGSAKLICKARGHPKPDIVWKREDGAQIISRAGISGGKTKIPTAAGETLTLSKVTRSEMGAYLCIASNGVPPSVSKRMMLHVHYMQLPEHSKKVSHNRNSDDDPSETIGDRDHRLNHVYQGSLRETGSTLGPSSDKDNASTSKSAMKRASFIIYTTLIASCHLFAFT